MTPRQIVLAALSVAPLLAVLGGAAAAQEERRQEPPSIQVMGEAVVRVPPDQARVDIGVVTQAQRSQDAAAQNAQRLEKVLADLRAAAGPEGQVQTIGYSLRPDYRQPGERGGEPTISGYTATNVVQVTLNDLGRIARVIDAATASGANQLQALRFELKDEHGVRTRALGEAAQRARAKAEALATALNLQIVRVLALSEAGAAVVPMRDVMFARAEAAAVTPIEPGTVEIRATVNLEVEVRGS